MSFTGFLPQRKEPERSHQWLGRPRLLVRAGTSADGCIHVGEVEAQHCIRFAGHGSTISARSWPAPRRDHGDLQHRRANITEEPVAVVICPRQTTFLFSGTTDRHLRGRLLWRQSSPFRTKRRSAHEPQRQLNTRLQRNRTLRPRSRRAQLLCHWPHPEKGVSTAEN